MTDTSSTATTIFDGRDIYEYTTEKRDKKRDHLPVLFSNINSWTGGFLV